MDPLRIAVRAVVTAIYLVGMTRLTGKRVVSQATPFDLVVSLIIGDLIDDALWADVPMTKFAAAAGTIFLSDIAVSFLAFRSPRISRLVHGVPVIAIRSGEVDLEALRGDQMNEADLEHLLRLQGRDEPGEVRIGVLEFDHELAVLPTDEAEPATRGDAEVVRRTMDGLVP